MPGIDCYSMMVVPVKELSQETYSAGKNHYSEKRNLTILGHGLSVWYFKKLLTYHFAKIIALSNPKKLQGKRSVS